MCETDVAQAIELRQWEFNNQAPVERKLVYCETDPEFGPAECIECGDDMPMVRRQYGFKICVACKTKRERISSR